ncbi:hypothetical protein BDV36DRAFT_294347 [Aspergillus pseudocaelatus]|uniref:Uncharacterized protein n=1 Tax=Aspergillus pseudocaelatus TaxID=1825620 RepID=A0ABQ6WQA9_9EURO|nr:hypothetical protein BDV36DRAFT_294347 [Aspergillus pseudocaelatus]
MDLRTPKRRHRLRETQLHERSHGPSIALHGQQGPSRLPAYLPRQPTGPYSLQLMEVGGSARPVCLWAATAPGAGNNIFNVTNGDTKSFQSLWPRMAEYFGFRIPENMFGGGGDGCPCGEVDLPVDPQKWAKRTAVKEAWAMLRDKYSLDQAAWDKATWDFLTFVLGRECGRVASMSKARKLGWTGYEDT